jgi:hypothetical protein
MVKIRTLSGSDYLRMNEPAARHLFDGLRQFINLAQAIDMREAGRRSAKPETRSSGDATVDAFERCWFTVAVFSGTILQLADIGVHMCSTNSAMPDSCRALEITDNMAKHCVGREVHGIPIGTIIHAARNQFAHWSDEDESELAGFRRFTKTIFDRLFEAHEADPLMDMTYELGNRWYGGTPIRSSDIVLNVLGWRTYESYAADMMQLIGKAAA